MPSSGPVRATSFTVGTLRHTSTNVSADGRLVAGSMSLMFGGSGNVILTRPFWRRLLKSLALSPLVRKSSASIGRNSGSSAFGFRRRRRWRSWNLASTLAGDSWKLSVAMWQSAHARPFAASPVQLPVEECEEAAHDGVAGLAAAVVRPRPRVVARVTMFRWHACHLGGGGPDQER